MKLFFFTVATTCLVFLTAAGNENDAIDIDTEMRALANFPNVIAAGEADFAGNETFFLAHGESVDVYANGHKTPGKISGGETSEHSGSSWAANRAGYLTGKLQFVDPKIASPETIELIEWGFAISI